VTGRADGKPASTKPGLRSWGGKNSLFKQWVGRGRDSASVSSGTPLARLKNLPGRSQFGRAEPRSAADNRNVQVIVEIEATAATVERLFMISERQEWTFGETLEYALDALELALAKMATG
jgi:hypothetical protein